MTIWVVCVGLGLAVGIVQLACVRRQVRSPAPPPPRCWPAISILKPLCGVDDDLVANLEAFAALRYAGDLELLLGVRDTGDAAYPVALGVARRHRARVRVVVQRGEPGLNPKVNQLLTLAAAARGEIVVISDSNVRPPDDYLEEIAARLDDPDVCLVTHAVAGAGERRFGALLDNLHLAAVIGPGVIAAKRFAGRDLVVGKSMAMRASELRQAAGLARVKDVLAEDNVLGNALAAALGKRVELACRPVASVASRRSVRDFYRRYTRWAILRRKQVPLAVYLAEPLLNPILVAAVAHGLILFGVACAAKIAIDLAAARELRAEPFGWRAPVAVIVKDLVAGAAWATGLVMSTVEWRGVRYHVGRGTVLSREPPPPPLGESRRNRRSLVTSAPPAE